MGGCDFHTMGVGKTYTDAYNDAVDEAEHYSGHDPYNGTISTTHGCHLITDAPRYGTKAFYVWLDKRMEKLEKCDCECVQVKGKAEKEFKTRKGLVGKKGRNVFFFYGIARE